MVNLMLKKILDHPFVALLGLLAVLKTLGILNIDFSRRDE